MTEIATPRADVNPKTAARKPIIRDYECTIRLTIHPDAPSGQELRLETIRPVDPAGSAPDPGRAPRRPNLGERAIALLVGDEDRWAGATMKQFARALHCATKTLYRYPIFVAARQQLRAERKAEFDQRHNRL